MYLFIDLDKTKDKGIIKSEFLENIREHFSEEDEKAGLKKRLFKKRFIPTRRYIITETGRFEIGLLTDILKYLKSLNTPFKVVFSEEFKQRYACAYSFANDPIIELAIPSRDYQLEGAKKALTNGNGIELVPTGAGKTLIMALLVVNVMARKPETKVLVITLTHLINQVYEEFLSYGINPQIISKWSGETDLNTSSNIVICGTNILYSKIENTALEIKKAKVVYLILKKKLEDYTMPDATRKETEAAVAKIEKDILRIKKHDDENKKIHDYLETINLLIVDEIHTYKKDNEITNITKFIQTRNRFGFTGTMPESLIDQWTIIGKIGPIIHEVPRDVLVQQKYITDVDVKILSLSYKTIPLYDMIDDSGIDDDGEELTSNYEAELSFIHKNAFRNSIIKKISEKVDKNILIVVDRLEHGEHLLTYLTSELQNKKVYFIKGEVENEDRDKIKKIMEGDDNVVCIAISKIFSTGVNIKNLHYILFASAGKAKIKTIQTIGRGVRTLEGKDKVVIFDVADDLRYGRKHLQKRITIYDNEELKHQTTEIKEGQGQTEGQQK